MEKHHCVTELFFLQRRSGNSQVSFPLIGRFKVRAHFKIKIPDQMLFPCLSPTWYRRPTSMEHLYLNLNCSCIVFTHYSPPQHIILSLSESVTCCTADFGLEPRKVRRLIKSLSSALSHCKHCYVRYSQDCLW